MKVTNLTQSLHCIWGKSLLVAILVLFRILHVSAQNPCAPDILPPSIFCPSSISVTLQSGLCETTVQLPSVTATDNCDPTVTITQIGGIANGDFFPIGTNTVTFRAADDAGNFSTCSFDVTILEYPFPTQSMSCSDEVQITLLQDGTAFVGAEEILVGGPYGCYDDYIVSITNEQGIEFLNLLSCDEIGQDLIVKVMDPDNGNSCWGHIVLEDKNPPVVTCQDRVVPCTMALTSIPRPTVTDNCDNNPTLHLSGLTPLELDACDDNAVHFQRTWVATDDYGNSSSPCVETITVERPLEVDFPNDIAWTCEQYSAFPNITAATGLHRYVGDSNPITDLVIDVNLDPTCNGGSDNSSVNSTNILNGGNGCPGPGLDDRDVLAQTGSGFPANIDGIYCKYNYTHSDDTVAICSGVAGVFKIVRTWTVIDWCTGDVIVTGIGGEDNVQVIKVMDITPPVITATNLTVHANVPGVHPLPCRSTAPFPFPTVTDACSGVASVTIITPVGAVVDGHIPAPGLLVRPQPYNIIIEAIDNCGNETEQVVQLYVVDGIAPTPICISYTEVNLESEGYVEVLAEAFDQASYDNCCLDHFAVRRMDDDACDDGINDFVFQPSVHFCCADAGKTKTVVFRAFDCFGNYNDCMVQVKVNDKLFPVLVSCPPNQRISCDWYADNLETQLANLSTATEKSQLLDQVFGAPIFFDNCDLVINRSFANNIDQCLEGTITRNFTATDPAGNTAVQPCSQTINIDHVSDWAVQFPADITVNCGTTPPDFGEPQVFYETCELVAISYDDVVYTVVPDACYKIVRTWTVINWCVVGTEVDQEVVEQPENLLGLPFPQCDVDSDGDCDGRTFRDSWRNGSPGNLFRPTVIDANRATNPDTDPDSDPWDGFITYQQVIKIIDTVDPIFTNGCAIPMVCINDNTCGAEVLLPTPDVMDCSTNLSISAEINIGGVWLSGFGPYLNVPPGMYQVHYNAMDNCNNQAVCNTTIKVKDCKKPTPYCKSGIIITLMGGDPPMIEVWASDLDDNSFDNCTSDLIFSFSPDTTDTSIMFFCNSQNTTQIVNVYVTDECGNQDFCTTFISIQDNLADVCGDPLVANLGGLLSNEQHASIQDVEMNLGGAATDMVMTDSSGMYNFDISPLGGDYSLVPHKDDGPMNGVTTFDLVLISKHILGVTPLDSPYKLIAADANRSGTVTTFDLVEIRKLILFINTTFPNNTSWRFVDKHFIFPNPSNPWQTPFPEFMNINNLNDDHWDADFIGVKIGDVNGSAVTSNATGQTGERTNLENLVFETENIRFEKGQTIEVPFQLNSQDLAGFQFTLGFDATKLGFTGVDGDLISKDNFGFAKLDDGVITVSWNRTDGSSELFNGEIFTISFIAKEAGELKDLLEIGSKFTSAEAYGANMQNFGVELSFTGKASTGFELYQNSPNPFKDFTKISFNLPNADACTLTFTDISGRVLKVIDGDFTEGYHQLKVKRADLNTTGVIYYCLQGSGFKATKMMILTD